jgi:hypothetical protein
MNYRVLAATLLLSSVILWLRSAIPSAGTADDRWQRRGLLVLALLLPPAGVAVGLLPWRVAAALIAAAAGLGVLVVRRRLPPTDDRPAAGG